MKNLNSKLWFRLIIIMGLLTSITLFLFTEGFGFVEEKFTVIHLFALLSALSYLVVVWMNSARLIKGARSMYFVLAFIVAICLFGFQGIYVGISETISPGFSHTIKGLKVFPAIFLVAIILDFFAYVLAFRGHMKLLESRQESEIAARKRFDKESFNLVVIIHEELFKKGIAELDVLPVKELASYLKSVGLGKIEPVYAKTEILDFFIAEKRLRDIMNSLSETQEFKIFQKMGIPKNKKGFDKRNALAETQAGFIWKQLNKKEE